MECAHFVGLESCVSHAASVVTLPFSSFQWFGAAGPDVCACGQHGLYYGLYCQLLKVLAAVSHSGAYEVLQEKVSLSH